MTHQDIEARRYQGYQEYLARQRDEIARPLGANVLLSTVTLGITETPQPRAEFREKPKAAADTSRGIGVAALANTVQVARQLEFNDRILTGHQDEYALTR